MSYHTAKENKVNALYYGHYATEKGGLFNLMNLIKKKLKVQCIFIDSPTGM